jgi:HD-like signal output (HDOD) protein
MQSAHLDEAKIAEMIESMPAFPKSVQQVLALADDINCNPRELVRVVEHDPVLTGRMLKVVNSAYFGLSRRISSVKEALAFIGLNTLKNVALTLAAVGALPTNNKAGLKMDEFLENSLAVGGTCRWLASRAGLGIRDSDRAFLAGLLHDFGTVVLALQLPAVFRELRTVSTRVNREAHVVELEVLGTHNFELGALVAEKWQLEQRISETIRHHRASPDGVDRTALMDCLWASVALVREIKGSPIPDAAPASFQDNIGTTYLNLLEEREAVEQAIERTQIFRTV